MSTWLTRIRGALGMGLTWAVVWALAGILIGVASILLPGLPWDAFFRVFDAPLPALAVPGFVGGAIFSTVLGIAGRHRSFDELSLPRFAAWGAVGGLLLSLVPLVLVGLSLGTPADMSHLWRGTLVLMVPATVLGALSAAGSLALARRAEDHELIDSSTEVANVGSSAEETRELLGPNG